MVRGAGFGTGFRSFEIDHDLFAFFKVVQAVNFTAMWRERR
jgi:hypothetical protein